jgi:subtilisin family serine protease
LKKGLLLACLLVIATAGPWGPRAAAATPDPAFVPDEIVVQYRDGAGEAQVRAARGRVNGVSKKRVRAQASGAASIEVLGLPTRANVRAAIAALRGDPAVEIAEPNWIYTRPVTSAIPGDRGYTNGSLWGMYGDDRPAPVGPAGTTNPYGSQAEKAWAAGKTGGKAVYVGVIDEGIKYAHVDLGANVWANPGEVPDNGIDDDGDGYIDDVHGFDFYHNDGSVYDPGEDNHGTHVAGTIGARADATTWDGQCPCGGVVGVNWDVTLISGKFLGPDGGNLADAIRAVDYFTYLKTRRGLNIVALNNSWTGGGYSQLLLDAIVRAARANILFIAAAGNDGSNNDALPSYPSAYDTTTGAGYDSVIAVAAIDQGGAKPSWSNWGARTVDLGAPGDGIWSTTATPNQYANDPYSSYSGTSMATPHVTGAAALYAAAYPKATAAQIRAALLGTTIATPALRSKAATNGRLNIDGALKKAPGTR